MADRVLHNMDPAYLWSVIYHHLYLSWYFMFYLKTAVCHYTVLCVVTLSGFLFSDPKSLFITYDAAQWSLLQEALLELPRWSEAPLSSVLIAPCVIISLVYIPRLHFLSPNSFLLCVTTLFSHQKPPHCQISYLSVFILSLSSMDTADHSLPPWNTAFLSYMNTTLFIPTSVAITFHFLKLSYALPFPFSSQLPRWTHSIPRLYF